jgi:RNase H-fold protein (predicted Holliday junction resolvase)
MKNTGLKNEVQVGEILKSGSLVLTEQNSAGVRLFRQSDRSDGIISGKLTRPDYDVAELKKSIDTTIFELIPNTPAPGPDTVLRSVYNVVTQSVNDLTLEVQRLNGEVNDLTAKVSELEIVSESLRIDADNERLKANIAQDQSTIANKQISTTTIDLQNAVQNSINEAVQRVSLTARIEALQESFRVQKELTEEREKQNAAQNALEGLNGFFQQTENSGWKISANDVKEESRLGFYVNVENRGDFEWKNGEKGIAFFNFSTEEQTFTLTKSSADWLEIPSSFKVPARNEQSAGVTTATFAVTPIGKTSKRKQVKEGTVVINTSSGDKLELKVYYRKEVKRKNKFDKQGKSQVFVGQDKTGG